MLLFWLPVNGGECCPLACRARWSLLRVTWATLSCACPLVGRATDWEGGVLLPRTNGIITETADDPRDDEPYQVTASGEGDRTWWYEARQVCTDDALVVAALAITILSPISWACWVSDEMRGAVFLMARTFPVSSLAGVQG
eukprot:COSAG01_NODE_30681_length_611_cov_1.373047_1_plen_141_part_00